MITTRFQGDVCGVDSTGFLLKIGTSEIVAIVASEHFRSMLAPGRASQDHPVCVTVERGPGGEWICVALTTVSMPTTSHEILDASATVMPQHLAPQPPPWPGPTRGALVIAANYLAQAQSYLAAAIAGGDDDALSNALTNARRAMHQMGHR